MGAALAAVPAVFWDAWLLSRFPGRTLEELEHVDILRLLRARRVQMIAQAEELRKESRRSDTQSKLDTAAWAAIKRHDKLLKRFED